MASIGFGGHGRHPRGLVPDRPPKNLEAASVAARAATPRQRPTAEPVTRRPSICTDFIRIRPSVKWVTSQSWNVVT